MASERVRSRHLRRILRTLFSSKRWLAGFVLAGGLVGWSYSAMQPRTYLGQMELAAAPEGTPGRVVLPTLVRLRQLVFAPENLAALANQKGRDDVERLTRSARLDRVLGVPTAASEVWQLSIEIRSDSSHEAQQRIDQYRERIEADFRKQIELARGSTNEARTYAASVDGSANVKQAGYEPDADELPPIIPPSSPSDEPLAELARELDVRADELPGVVEALRGDLDRQSAEIRQKEALVSDLVDFIHRIETDPLSVKVPGFIEASQPALRALRERRESLLSQRTQLAASLRPAHPQWKALERTIAETESQLKSALLSVVASYQSEVTRLEGESRKLRDIAAHDRQRLAQLIESLKRSRPSIPIETHVGERSQLPVVASQPLPLPEELPTVDLNRPPGRVVLPGVVINQSPLRPRTVRNVLVGAFIGLFSYLIWVIVRAGSDQRIHSIDDMEELAVYVFGSIPENFSGAPVTLSHSTAP